MARSDRRTYGKHATERSFKAASRRINKAAKILNRQTPHAIRMIAEEIMTDVKASRPGHGVPVDTGALRSSGRVDQAKGFTNPEVELGFGDQAAPYALYQHETLDLRHKVGEPRYLVRGLARWRPTKSAAMRAIKANAKAGLRAAGRR